MIKTPMTGAYAPNPHEGSRSEILADYLFSSWGTVTPVRRGTLRAHLGKDPHRVRFHKRQLVSLMPADFAMTKAQDSISRWMTLKGATAKRRGAYDMALPN